MRAVATVVCTVLSAQVRRSAYVRQESGRDSRRARWQTQPRRGGSDGRGPKRCRFSARKGAISGAWSIARGQVACAACGAGRGGAQRMRQPAPRPGDQCCIQWAPWCRSQAALAGSRETSARTRRRASGRSRTTRRNAPVFASASRAPCDRLERRRARETARDDHDAVTFVVAAIDGACARMLDAREDLCERRVAAESPPREVGRAGGRDAARKEEPSRPEEALPHHRGESCTWPNAFGKCLGV